MFFTCLKAQFLSKFKIPSSEKTDFADYLQWEAETEYLRELYQMCWASGQLKSGSVLLYLRERLLLLMKN